MTSNSDEDLQKDKVAQAFVMAVSFIVGAGDADPAVLEDVAEWGKDIARKRAEDRDKPYESPGNDGAGICCS